MRRLISALAGIAMLSPMLAAPAAAQDYPTQNVLLIVPDPPGGPPDVIARRLLVKRSASRS